MQFFPDLAWLGPPARAAATGLIAATALLGLGARAALPCSQCMCGMPFPPDALGGPAPQKLRFGLEEQYLSKKNGLDDAPGVEQEQEHHVGAYALARVSSRVMLLGRLPWVFKQITSEPVGEASTIARSDGLGDAELLSLVKLHEFPLGERAALLSAVGGARIPTGANQMKDATGARLDEHLQPGSGAWSGIAGVDLTLPLTAGRLDLNASYRVHSENSEHYRYGSAFLYNAGFARRVGSVLELSLQLNGRAAQQDQLSAGILAQNTGGSVLYVAPIVRWFAGPGVLLEAGAQFPIASAPIGIQEEHATARLAVSLAR
jgi:hypothetical protein